MLSVFFPDQVMQEVSVFINATATIIHLVLNSCPHEPQTLNMAHFACRTVKPVHSADSAQIHLLYWKTNVYALPLFAKASSSRL